LFRRILQHPDFIAAKIDTGFLDRLLAQTAAPAKGAPENTDDSQPVAAIAAALFTAIQASKPNGKAPAETTGTPGVTAWKQAARKESMGGK